MTKSILPIALLGAAFIFSTGCKNDSGFKKLKGIEYKIVKDLPGKKAVMGDIIEFNIKAKADTTELANTWKQGKTTVGQVSEVKNGSDLRAIFPFLAVGDSAVVMISCDSIIKTIPPAQLDQVLKMQPWMKKGNKIVINISVVSIKTKDEYQKEMEAKQGQMQQEMQQKAASQLPIDDKLLQDYFAKNNIKAQRSASGLYYTIQKPGAGAPITKGETVSMSYTGKTLNGAAFDSNVDTSIGHHGTAPLVFTVGVGQMIPGVDEGVGYLKKGSKATLYLPSPLGYGPNGQAPKIGPNSILVFDIDITDVKAASKPPMKPVQ